MKHKKEVLLVNGWSASSSLWRHFISLAQEKGLFHSTQVRVQNMDQPYSLDEWIALLQEQISAESLVLGWSLGGMLALKAINQIDPARMPNALILMNSPPGFHRRHWPYGMPSADFDQFKKKATRLPKEMLKTFSYLLTTGSSTRRQDAKQLEKVFNPGDLPDQVTLLKGLELLETLNAVGEWKQPGLPVLVIAGEKDALVSAKSIKNGAALNSDYIQYQLIPGMGHLPQLEFSSQVLDEIKSFLITAEHANG